MAIYHLSGSVISRSQGRSAIACAAYRAAERLLDERLDKTHDYTYKQDVAFCEILLPENAPSWMKDREKLWNAVEQAEKRKDAQLAREMQIALPRELTLEQNIALAREFIQQEFVDRGMIADWAMHLDKAKDGEAQPHIHVMLTMREITEEGFGQKVRVWNAKENLLLWRQHWAETANRHLALHGIDRQIDHRSHLERGIELEPQHKIGAMVAQDRMARLADHQRIARDNGEKIFDDPGIALDALTRQQSTFTHHDLAKFIARHSIDSEQFQRVYDKVKGSEQMVNLGLDNQGRERFTTQAMLTLEKDMLAHGNVLIDRDWHEVKRDAYQQGLIKRSLSDEQQLAYEHLLGSGDLTCVVGYAGTGKSYLLGAAREAWEAEGYRVHGVTLSGIAAENLAASSGIKSRTLASREYYWEQGQELLTAKDIVVVDEAGMLGSRQMARILQEAQQQGAKVVLIGDPQQLQAIEAGAAFRALSEYAGYVELTEVRRQRHEWQREATKALANGHVAEALARYQRHDQVHEFESQAQAKKALVEQWNDVRISNQDKTQVMLAYTRQDVKELNEMARELRKGLGELGQEQILATAKGDKAFAENERVYFLQNDRGLGVKNGSLGTIEKMVGKVLTVRLDSQEVGLLPGIQRITVDIDKYPHIDYGYAATIHKAQGVTVDRSYLLASRHMDSHATYVGMSRHRESVELFWSREEFANQQALGQALNRERHKDVTLDYGELGQGFARQRGIEISEELEKSLADTSEIFKQMREALQQDFALLKEMPSFKLPEREIANPMGSLEKLKRFREEFKQENPELFKPCAHEKPLAQEKRAREIYQQFIGLEQKRVQSYFPHEVEREMEKLASVAMQDKAVIGYLHKQAPELSKRVEGFAKAHEKRLEREKDLGLELEL